MSVQLSNKYVDLVEELVGHQKSKEAFTSPTITMVKSRGMSFDLPQVSGQEVPYYPPETILDLSLTAKGLAVGNPDLEKEFSDLGDEAKQAVDEKDLLSRCADYEDAMAGITSATEMLRAISPQIEAEFNTGRQDWVGRLLSRVKELVSASLNRILGGMENGYNGFVQFGQSVDELLNSLADRAKDKIVTGFHKLAHSLSALFARVISNLFGFLAVVKSIAKARGFTLGEITVGFGSMSFDTVSLFGVSIPVPKFTTPNVSMKFS
jgi:hypothetical protein